MKKILLISLAISLQAHSQHPSDEPSFFEDLAEKVVPPALELVPGASHKMKSRAAGIAETAEQANHAVHEANPSSPNSIRNAILETGLFMGTTLASVPLRLGVFASEVSGVASRHYEKGRDYPNLSDDERMSALATFATFAFPDPNDPFKVADDFPLDREHFRKGGEEFFSQTLKAGAYPAKLFHETAHGLTSQYLAPAADSIGLTEENARKRAEQARRVVKYVRDSVVNGSTRASETSKKWLAAADEALGKTGQAIRNVPARLQAAYEEFNSDPLVNNEFTLEQQAYLNSLFAEETRSLQEVMKPYFAALQRIDGRFVSEDKAREALQKQQAELKQFEVAADTLIGMSEAASMIASLSGNKSDAAKIAKFGSSMASFMMSTKKLSVAMAETVTVASLAHPVAGVIASIASLISIFGDDDGGSEISALIAEFARALSLQIETLYVDVMKRFDGLENRIDGQYRSVMFEFFKVHSSQQDIQRELAHIYKEQVAGNHKLIGQMRNLEARSAGYHSEDLAQFAALRTEGIAELLEEIRNDIQTGLNPKTFAEHIKKLHQKIVITAISSALTGGNIDINNAQRVAEALDYHGSSAFSNPAFSHIQLIRGYEESRCPNLAQLQSNDIAHPLVWIRAAETLRNLLYAAVEQDVGFESESEKKLCLRLVGEVLTVGTNTLTMIKRASDKECIEQLFRSCSDNLNAIAKLIEEHHIAPYFGVDLNKEMAERVASVSKESVFALGQRQAIPFTILEGQLANVTKGVKPNTGLKTWWSAIPLESAILVEAAENARNPEKEKQLLTNNINAYNARTKELRQLIELSSKEKVASLRTRAFTQSDFVGEEAPLSRWIYPTDQEAYPNFYLHYDDLKVGTLYTHAELLELGRIHAEFEVQASSFVVNVYFVSQSQKQLIKRLRTSHELADTTPESIYSFWEGLRYTKKNDTLTHCNQACLALGADCTKCEKILADRCAAYWVARRSKLDVHNWRHDKSEDANTIVFKWGPQQQAVPLYDLCPYFREQRLKDRCKPYWEYLERSRNQRNSNLPRNFNEEKVTGWGPRRETVPLAHVCNEIKKDGSGYPSEPFQAVFKVTYAFPASISAPAFKSLAVVPGNYDDVSAAVTALVKTRVEAQHKGVIKKIAEDVSTSSETPLYRAVQKHEAEHKLIESIFMLAYADQFSENNDPLKTLAISESTPLRGKNSLISGLKASSENYLPIEESLAAYNATATMLINTAWSHLPALSALIDWLAHAQELTKLTAKIRPSQQTGSDNAQVADLAKRITELELAQAESNRDQAARDRKNDALTAEVIKLTAVISQLLARSPSVQEL